MITPTEICKRLKKERGGATWYDPDTGACQGQAYEIAAYLIAHQAAEIERLTRINVELVNSFNTLNCAGAKIEARAEAAEAALEKMCEATNNLLTRMFSTYKARNGREVGIEADDGEACWIVHSDDIETLRSALPPTTREAK